VAVELVAELTIEQLGGAREVHDGDVAVYALCASRRRLRAGRA
jgi:hypothetical protein